MKKYNIASVTGLATLLLLCIMAILVAVMNKPRQSGESMPVHQLNGSYRSDKEATMNYLNSTGHYTKEQLKLFDRILGKLEVSYSQTTATTIMDGTITTNTYHILDSGPDYMVVTYTNKPLLPGDSPTILTSRLDLVPDGYWQSEGGMEAPYKEKFTQTTSAQK